jgi:hypothetical protein
MTTRLSIPKPDVKVTITTRTVTPVVATPALPACIVGPCYEVLDPQLSAGLAANPDAMITLPAMIRGHAQPKDVTIATDDVTLTLVINGVTVTVSFPVASPGPTYTVAQILSRINAAIALKSAPAVAELIGTGTTQRFVLRTTGDGAGNYIIWTVASNTAANIPKFCGNATMGVMVPSKCREGGIGYYDQLPHIFQELQYPDPKGIIDQLDVDPATVRVFGSISSGLSEWLQTTTVERCGASKVKYTDDGDTDGYTNLVVFSNPAGEAIPSDDWPATVDATLILLAGGSPGRAVYTAPGAALAPLANSDLTLTVNGMRQVISLLTTDDSATKVRDKINAYFPGLAASDPIVLTAANLDPYQFGDMLFKGRESYIKIEGDTVNLLARIFNAGAVQSLKRGDWYDVQAGAQLYVNGTFLGNVIEVGADYVKLDREIPDETVAATRSWYFVTTNIPATAQRGGDLTSFPSSDLFVSSGTYEAEGVVRIKQELLRAAQNGAPQESLLFSAAVGCDMLMGYTGLRLDVTPSATDADLLAYSSVTDLTTDLAPIDTTNPLGLGMYYAMVNSPGLTVYGMGVDEVTTAEPEGTLDAYTEVAEFLESREIYSIAQLSHSEDVAFMFQVHVDLMSDPELKGERILWWNPNMPTRERSMLIASGAKGNCAAPAIGTLAFGTGLADLPARFVAAGITATTFTPATDGVYVQLESQGSKLYAVQSYSGSVLTLVITAMAAPFETAFWTGALVDEPFTIGKLGASLYDVNGKYDKQAASEAIYDLGQEFKDRRVRMVVPDEVTATIGGLEQIIAGYYACACLAGMKAYNNPALGFTNMKLGGLDRVQRTEGYFKESQLNLMAGGGAWILIPATGGGGVMTRMALTTDTSSVEYRQDSWTSAIDYGSKYLRIILRRVIGPTNITQAAMDLVASLCSSAIQFLKANEIWNDGTLDSIDQSDVAPDSLDVGISAQIPYNLNYINVTITV